MAIFAVTLRRVTNEHYDHIHADTAEDARRVALENERKRSVHADVRELVVTNTREVRDPGCCQEGR